MCLNFQIKLTCDVCVVRKIQSMWQLAKLLKMEISTNCHHLLPFPNENFCGVSYFDRASLVDSKK